MGNMIIMTSSMFTRTKLLFLLVCVVTHRPASYLWLLSTLKADGSS